ncbi:hypothetical protein TELCIR_08327 [Teladorsagia circumcincta]|uniref:SHSP domain-containing protein n=1 Tax=Teladorsagia circumcincta TaxID=45464 RepID=A0A2G9UI25_TELCI|nr:hypothetical protein TELCIR_08327 [Teladorsagia circumcincta]
MDLCVMPCLMNCMMYDTMRDFDRFERSIFPYWREADHSVLTWPTKLSRSFTRKWLLLENVDLNAVRTQLDEKVHLSVEAPKNTGGQEKKRTFPIMAAPRKD